MIGIVETDADELAGACNAWAKAWVAFDLWQRIDVQRTELGECFRVENGTRQITDMGREITDIAVGIEKARLLLTGFAIAKKFHEITPFGDLKWRTYMVQPPSMLYA